MEDQRDFQVRMVCDKEVAWFPYVCSLILLLVQTMSFIKKSVMLNFSNCARTTKSEEVTHTAPA